MEPVKCNFLTKKHKPNPFFKALSKLVTDVGTFTSVLKDNKLRY